MFFSYTTTAQYRFDSWTTDNGLPQNGVRMIAQTPDGYIWFTTFGGLVRFDGIRFTVFDKGNTPGIVNNRFSVLYADKAGTLWAATEDGTMTIYRDGVFTSFEVSKVIGHGIHHFEDDGKGETRFLSLGGPYYYFRNGELIYAAPREDEDPQKKIFNAPSGTQWTITRNEVDQVKDGRVTTYPVTIRNMSKIDPAESALEDMSGGFWFGEPGKIFHLHDGVSESFDITDGKTVNIWPHSFWQEADGAVWCATGDYNFKGIGLVHIQNGRLSRFGLEAGLSNDRIFFVLKDREGTIWIATNKGLNRMRRQIVTAYSEKDGLADDEVYPIMETRGGDVLVGTASGISSYRDGVFKRTVYGGSLDFDNIQGLMEDSRGRVWMGVIGNLVRYENGRNIPYGTGTTTSIITDRNGSLWAASAESGLSRIDDDKVTANYTTSEGLPSNDIKALYEDTDGSLWLGTYGGLSQFKDGKFTNYTVDNGLPSNRVRSLYKDAEGTFWIGTYDGGLSRFKDGKFFNFTTENGLFNNGVFATLEDNNGNFWISCNKGIFRVNKNQLNDFADGKIAHYDSFSYGKEDGMLNTECNGGRQPSALKDKKGNLWFPTLGGVVVVDPGLVISNPLPPPVQIENVLVDRENASFKDGVRVDPAKTSVDITYTAPSFIKSDQIRFKYKLEGLDKDWIDAGTRRTVNYSYLPPGEYTFTVTAANSDGVWNQEGKSTKIAVIAPFYRTGWFLALMAVFVAGVIYLIYSSRLSQIRKIHAAREAFSDQLVESQEAFSRQLIESQEAERKRIAAELHDGLGQNLLVIKNRALLGLSVADEDKSKEQFGEIQESVTEALAEVRTIAYNLRPLHLDRLGLTSTIEEMLEQVESASGIEIDCDVEPIDGLLTKEREINFYRIVQECLNNIVKHSGATKASVSVFRENGILVLTVKDNGLGFDVDQAVVKHAGLGLNGIAERAKILGGTYLIESEPGQGATVTVEIGLDVRGEGAKGRRG